MNDDLFGLMSKIITNNPGLISHKEPEVVEAEDVLLKMLQKQQSARIIYQSILIFGLLIFITIQVVYINNMYDDAIKQIFEITSKTPNLSNNCFELYTNIFKQIKFYTSAVLCEFLAMLFFIIKWGFSTSNDLDINSMFKDFKLSNSTKKQKRKSKV